MIEGYLTTADVAAILGVSPQTVRAFRVRSRSGGQYAEHPFPEPDSKVGNMPVWRAAREREIRAWSAGRVGQGVGGGRPSHRPSPTA